MKIKLWWQEEKGAATVLVAAAMLCLLGMAALVVDVGSLYVQRRQMVTAADAAALAGVKELALTADEAAAVTVANEYSALNGAEQTIASVIEINWKGEKFKAVDVSSNVEEELIFARVFGQSSSGVAADAMAVWFYPTKYQGPIYPIFFQLEGNNLPQENQLLLSEKIGPGNWSLMDIGSGAKTIKDAFAGNPYSYDEFVASVSGDGTVLEAYSQTGQVESQIKSVEERMIKAASGEVSMTELIPIVRTTEVKGKTKIYIVGFAPFEILDVITDNKGHGSKHALVDGKPVVTPQTYDEELYTKGTIVGRFVESLFIPGVDIDMGSQDEDYNFGVVSIKLIE